MLTIEPDLNEALEEADEEAEDTEETVDMVEMGLMVDVLPDRDESPESELLWLW